MLKFENSLVATKEWIEALTTATFISLTIEIREKSIVPSSK